MSVMAQIFVKCLLIVIYPTFNFNLVGPVCTLHYKSCTIPTRHKNTQRPASKYLK